MNDTRRYQDEHASPPTFTPISKEQADALRLSAVEGAAMENAALDRLPWSTAEAQEIAALRSRLAAVEDERDALAARVPRWISVKEMMPENNAAVLVCCPTAHDSDGEGPFVASAFVLPDGTWQSQDSVMKSIPIPWPVAHWTPLPDPPANETTEGKL